MSIWSSVPGGPIKALSNAGDHANYGAEGEPALEVDVATTASWHDHIRLAIWGDHKDVDVLLSPAAALELAARLKGAVRRNTATAADPLKP